MPMVDSKKSVRTKQDVYESYLQADYTTFNQTFALRYDNYEQFLRKCGIVTKVNTNNVFFDETEPISFEEHLNNQQDLRAFYA